MAELEFLVEPFVEARPGPHVDAAVAAVRSAGLEPTVGAFSNHATGDIQGIAAAVAALITAAVESGADRIQIQVSTIDRSHAREDITGALSRLVDSVETELGAKLPDLDRAGKQAAVRLLDHRGAFLLRRAVEEVAETMSVSRITIYTYLNAIQDS
jgi:uncharacterized protein YqgV (UPF0045/DUF77 family)